MVVLYLDKLDLAVIALDASVTLEFVHLDFGHCRYSCFIKRV